MHTHKQENSICEELTNRFGLAWLITEKSNKAYLYTVLHCEFPIIGNKDALQVLGGCPSH